MYKIFIRPILFLFHPDWIHTRIVWCGRILGSCAATRKILDFLFVYHYPSLETEVCGIRFKNPVGLAGGFDKNGQLIRVIPSVGFGFMEVGSVTRYPYEGNPRPWNVRLKADESLIVNYGLKNEGAEAVRDRIQKHVSEIPLIVNIAKTNNAAIRGDGSIADYIASVRILQGVADMININISCPNTGDGMPFCENMDLLAKLLDALQKERITKPLFLKLKPDSTDETLEKIVSLARAHSCVSGFVISNLSSDRGLLTRTNLEIIQKYHGGISGKPIRDISTRMIRKIYALTNGAYPIIGVGGIFSAADAYEKIRAGASLVEVLTGMIYEGPGLIKKINRGLVELLKKDGFSSITQAVGADHLVSD